MTEPEPLLSVRGLVKHYPIRKGFPIQRTVATVHAVDGVDLDVYPGETLRPGRRVGLR